MRRRASRNLNMYQIHCEALGSGDTCRYRIERDGIAVRLGDAIDNWQCDDAFRERFDACLAGAPYAAYYWEMPPVTTANRDRPFEFVLIDSPFLARTGPDPSAFAAHFATAPTEPVVSFDNLGRDAHLVAPRRLADEQTYPHLAAFSRAAPRAQRHALWRAVGAAVAQRLGRRPIWLSTAGQGVAWLHVRLDRRPKYYNFAPYRDAE